MRKSILKITIVTIALAAVLSLPLSAGQPQAGTFTLESVLSSPFPSDLVTSPRGDIFAWAFDDQGRRNVWTAQAPDFKARQLTHFDQDEGIEVSELAFNFDGAIIVFVRNQGLNRSGEYPNPTSNIRGAEQAVWAQGQRLPGIPGRDAEAAILVQRQRQFRFLHVLGGRLEAGLLQQSRRPQFHRDL